MVATPPFNISTSTPADNDIVSQFPANERTNRDNINQWLLVDHDTNGDHVKMTMPYQSSAPATPAAGFLKMYADVNGNMVYVAPDGLVRYVGTPPGTIEFTSAATADNGYVFARGQAISRTGVGAALFARISTNYGGGDGSTTFNVPNINGKVIAGTDNGAGNLTGAILGANLGSEFHALTLAELAVHNHGLTDPTHQHVTGPGSPFRAASTAINISTAGATPVLVDGGVFLNLLSTGFAATGITVNNAGSGTGHTNVQATFALNAQIKL